MPVLTDDLRREAELLHELICQGRLKQASDQLRLMHNVRETFEACSKRVSEASHSDLSDEMAYGVNNG
ncbi:MAG: hypothetical protein AAGG69_02180 [Pseudomonadota bacterium]